MLWNILCSPVSLMILFYIHLKYFKIHLINEGIYCKALLYCYQFEAEYFDSRIKKFWIIDKMHLPNLTVFYIYFYTAAIQHCIYMVYYNIAICRHQQCRVWKYFARRMSYQLWEETTLHKWKRKDIWKWSTDFNSSGKDTKMYWLVIIQMYRLKWLWAQHTCILALDKIWDIYIHVPLQKNPNSHQTGQKDT